MNPRTSSASLLRVLALLVLLGGLVAGCLGTEATPTTVAPTATSAPPAVATNTPAATTGTVDAPTPTTMALATVTSEAVASPEGTTVAGATATTGGGTGVARPPRTRFAAYTYQPSTVQAGVPPYTVQANLSNVTNAADFTFSADQKTALQQNAFVVVPPRNVQISEIQWVYRQFYQLYEDGRYSETPTFVTTDSVLHVYHLMFDKLLRTAETNYLSGDALKLTQALLATSQEQYTALKGTAGESAAQRNVAYFAVAARLLDPATTVPAYVSDMVSKELALIEAHEGIAQSNLFADYDEDYSQFVPRGHYTRSETLERYFKAMMWYGQMTFRLKDADETRSAVLLAAALQKSEGQAGGAADLWASIYEPTSFFVGAADDLTYHDYWTLIQQVYGADPAPAALADAAKTAQFQELAKQLAAPRINSMFVYIDEDINEETKGFRFMGQRFTVDAYVLGQLIYRRVGTEAKPRLLPKALDVPAAMGSEEALSILAQAGDTDYAKYPEQMSKVRQELASLPETQWTENLYWSWLYTFFPLLKPHHDEGYPAFMRSAAWDRKELNTISGTWTELKHDTILYSKQVMAEAGGGPPEQIKGYVEPYPDFYGRLQALINMTQEGLTARGLLDESLKEPLTTLGALAGTLRTISEKELRNEALTADEYDVIQYFGGTIEHLTFASADTDGSEGTPTMQDQDSALVADVATGDGTVLEEATGHPTAIYVVVPIDGKLVIARGGVYSHYEFTVGLSERMTDETWKAQLNADKAPPLADWTGLFLKK
jgi:hypothetical protein